MWDIFSYLLFFVFIAALIVVAGLLMRGYMTTGTAGGALAGKFFGPKPEKRLDVVDQANVDGRRRLVLIRRDDVEHLIMTGGPVDVVIETNIGGQPVAAAVPVATTQGRARTAEIVEVSTPVYTRAARTFDKTAPDRSGDKVLTEKISDRTAEKPMDKAVGEK